MSDLRAAVRRRDPVAGTWVSVGHPEVAELSASLGFDFVTIDTEHAPTDLETVENMLRGVAAAPGDAGAVVRVPWNDPVRIKRVLDTGVDGVMAPMVDTAAEARAFVDAVRYPPEGSRGMAAARASNYGLDFEEYVASANDAILTVVQIESRTGVANTGAIAAVEGIDALLVGPADLSASLGALGEFDDEAVAGAIGDVLDAAHEVDVPVGTLATSTDQIADWVDRGFDFLVVGTDVGYLAAGGQAALATYRRSLDDE